MLLIVQVSRDLMTSDENNPKEATQALYAFCLAIIITRNTRISRQQNLCVCRCSFSQMQDTVKIYYISIIVAMRALEKKNWGMR